jgi:uncharacterized protein (DUF302 family)
MNEKQKENSKRIVSKWIILFSGVAAGFVFCGLIMFKIMPSMMIVTEECNFDFDRTVSELEKRVVENGWVLSGGKAADMNKSMAEHGVDFKPRVKLIKLCKPEYAKSVLETDRYVSAMMPCTMAVWEGDDGEVYLSKINMGLMAKMFGGNISKVMGKKVVDDENKILEGLLKK